MSQHEPEATPQQQEAVRRLLAEARHAEPLPDDVAARLDGVLAQLAAEGRREVDPPDAPVVDLAARRRKRVTGLLVAAAAVVVLGVGVGQVIDRTGTGDDDSAGAASSSNADDADSADGAAQQPAPGAAQDQPTGSGSPESGGGESSNESEGLPSAVPSRSELPAVVPPLGSADFQQSVERLRDADAVTSDSDSALLSAEDLTSESLFVCPPTPLGAGRLVAVSYAGSPAVLAYRPATGDTQVVELLQCGSGDVLRSVVVPAR